MNPLATKPLIIAYPICNTCVGPREAGLADGMKKVLTD